jgi:hypothetical protein
MEDWSGLRMNAATKDDRERQESRCFRRLFRGDFVGKIRLAAG